MMLGLGQTGTTTGTVTTAPTFSQGLAVWSTPSTALTDISTMFANPSVAFSSPYLGYTFGLLTPVLGVVALIMAARK